MKTFIGLSVSLLAVLALAGGCSQGDDPAPPAIIPVMMASP